MATIPIRSIAAKGWDQSADTLTTEASASLPAPASVAVGDRLIAVVVTNYTAANNTRIVTPTMPSGWTLVGSAQDANIGALSRSGTFLAVYHRAATGSDFPVAATTSTPSAATEARAAIMGFVIACRGDVPLIDTGTESGLANNINPTNSYTIDSHPTDPGGSLMFTTAANVVPTLYPGGENGMTSLHSVSFSGDVTRWVGIAVAEGSTTPTTADAAQWEVSSGGVQWATVFQTFGPWTGGGGIFVDGAVHLAG